MQSQPPSRADRVWIDKRKFLRLGEGYGVAPCGSCGAAPGVRCTTADNCVK